MNFCSFFYSSFDGLGADTLFMGMGVLGGCQEERNCREATLVPGYLDNHVVGCLIKRQLPFQSSNSCKPAMQHEQRQDE